MSTVQLEVPEEVLISLKEKPDTFARELGIAAAVKLFELGRLSSGRAAQRVDVPNPESWPGSDMGRSSPTRSAPFIR